MLLLRFSRFGTIVLSTFLLTLISCGETNISDQLSAGGTDTVSDDSDTTAPVLSGTIDVSADDDDNTNSPTSIWSAGTDAVGITRYELSIAEDDSSGTCDSTDFSGSRAVDWFTVPTGTDFSGAGYQVTDGNSDDDSNTLNVDLLGNTDYCTAVRAYDAAGNVSNVIYSGTWSYNYKSCNEILSVESSSTDGTYEIDPSESGTRITVFCDMSTQGGGWTLAIRYDRSEATAGAYSLPANSGRTQINVSDLSSINATGNLAASLDIRDFVRNGATYLMHVGKDDDAATDSSTYNRVYFSDIYQAVIDNPDNLFDSSLDTNNGDGLSGTVVSGVDATRKDRWYESDFSVMTVFDTDGDTTNNHRINGGEGNAMFTNGNREGAVYCTASTSGGNGHGDPKVQWGFVGADGTQQGYGATIHIGTYCTSGLGGCVPESQINMMFVR